MMSGMSQLIYLVPVALVFAPLAFGFYPGEDLLAARRPHPRRRLLALGAAAAVVLIALAASL